MKQPAGCGPMSSWRAMGVLGRYISDKFPGEANAASLGSQPENHCHMLCLKQDRWLGPKVLDDSEKLLQKTALGCSFVAGSRRTLWVMTVTV